MSCADNVNFPERANLWTEFIIYSVKFQGYIRHTSTVLTIGLLVLYIAEKLDSASASGSVMTQRVSQ